MAQYIQVQGTSFGNAHSDSPTYAFTEGSGAGVYLSGSGGYVNAATGITKATLTSGVKLKVENDLATAVTCSVESGFTCATEFEYATWTIVSPTPTPSPVISNVTITLLAAAQELGTWPEYSVTVAINGYKSTTRTLQQTNSNSVSDSFALSLTGTPNGTGTITFSRTSPDATVVDGATLSVDQLNGHTTSPTSVNYINGDTISSVNFSVSGFDHGEDMVINIAEG